MTVYEMLEKRHDLVLRWVVPYASCGPEGNYIPAHVTLQASVHDCVNMGRFETKRRGFPLTSPDSRYLLDFMATHMAEPVET